MEKKNLLESILAQSMSVGGHSVSVFDAIVFIVIILVARLVAEGVDQATRRVMLRRQLKADTEFAGLRKLVRYFIYIIGLTVALNALGVELDALFATGAIFAVGIGFALQNITQNFVSGIILLFERSINRGDVLEVDGHFVRIDNVGIRATLARTLDGEELIIPNTMLVQNTVKNYTLKDNAKRIGADVGVSYKSDMDQVRSVLMAAARSVHEVRTKKDVSVLCQGFGDSSVNYVVYIWTLDVWREPVIRDQLYKAIWDALREANVEIPFPQRDIHFKSTAL